MKNRVEIKYVSNAETFPGLFEDYWELNVSNDVVGHYTLKLSQEQAMPIAMAIATATDAGRKQGYDKAKKKYKAIQRIANSNIPGPRKPWEDAKIPMHWNHEWKLNDPNT